MFERLTFPKLLAALAGAVGVLAVPLVTRDTYLLHILILWMIFATFAVAYNVATGYAGLKTFGHHAFFALGAYVSALVAIGSGLSPWLTVWIGAVVAAVLGVAIGLPILRIRSMPHVAIVTLAFAEIVRIALTNLQGITRGELGLWGIPPFEGFTLPIIGAVTFSPAVKTGYYYVAAAMLGAALVLVALMMRSRTGLSIVAMRDGEDAAESLGINLTRTKLLVFGVSAAIVGVAGAFYAHYVGILTPSSVAGADLMILVIAMVLVGGLGTFVGPLIGSLILTYLGESLRFLEDYRLLVYGGLILLTMLAAPKGLASLSLLARRLRPASARI